jgi:tetratricopeptide (TPR) repeat protein
LLKINTGQADNLPARRNKIVKMRSIALFILLIALYPQETAKGIQLSDTARLNRYIKSGFSYIEGKEMQGRAKACIDSAILICEKRDIKPPAKLYLLRADYSFLKGDYRSASDFAGKAIEQARIEGNDYVHTLTLLFLGGYAFRTGSFQESLDYFDKAVALAEKRGYRGIKPRAIEGQTKVYGALEDFESNRLALNKMIVAATAENDTVMIIRGLHLLGTLHSEKLRNFSLCDSLLRRSFALSAIAGDYLHMSLAQANMGWNFYLARMYDSSITCYKRSLEISVPKNIYSLSANAYGNLGSVYRDLNDTRTSLMFYQKSIDISSKTRYWYNLQWVYKDMSDLYLRLNDTSVAFNYYVLHKQFSDSMLITNNTQGLAEARVRYEADSHKKEVELLSLKIKNQKLMIYGYTGITIFAIAIFLLLYRGSKMKNRRRISEMNRTISELTQANLRQQMNPHFIFNTLNSIQYYMYQHDKLATNNYLTKFTSLMRKVLENSQHTSVPIKDELEALNLYLELETLRFKDKFGYRITIDEEIDPLLFKIPTMLIQPYVENSICHGMIPGDVKGELKIDLKLEKDHITCTIEDNGIGREAAQKRKTTQGTNHNSLGTRIISSRLDLVNRLYGTNLKTIYTDLKNENGEPAGTRVEIHIPIIS